jgi:hypothetical protein
MSIHVSGHAIKRYRERVALDASAHDAAKTIATIVATGTRRPKPRRWCRPIPTRVSTRYVYSAAFPGVCVVVKDEVVVTVFSRSQCAFWRHRQAIVASGGQW